MIGRKFEHVPDILEKQHIFFWNYRYYAKFTIKKYPGREIMVLRTEHLREDIDNIERKPGGKKA
jgi:hypothetical protein